jgi:hypothetical protein
MPIVSSVSRSAKGLRGGEIYRYRMHLEDGSDVGEATYAVLIKPGEEILVGNGRRFRVLAVVPFEEEDPQLLGLLQVEGRVARNDASVSGCFAA